MIIDLHKNKKIGIFGLGLTGTSVYEAFNKNERIICWDDSEANRNKFAKQYPSSVITHFAGPIWQALDVIVMSPGIPQSHEIFSQIDKYQIPMSSDVQLFIEANPESEIIAITGTNGKSTTTALVHHILSEAGLDYGMGGNIGTPILSLPQNQKGYILELSSYQLDLLGQFNPTISVLLNITPDHIDRYGSFENYRNSKLRIFNNDSLKIIGVQGAELRQIYEKLKKSGDKQLIPVNLIARSEAMRQSASSLREAIDGEAIQQSSLREQRSNPGILHISGSPRSLALPRDDDAELALPRDDGRGIALSRNDEQSLAINRDDVVSCNENGITDDYFNCQFYELPKLKNLAGAHNQENIAAAFAVSRALGVEPEAIVRHIASFHGLAHRMQFVGSIGNISFYNDSKATNTTSAICSLAALGNIFWLAGGIFKEETLLSMENSLYNVKKAYLFGMSKLLFARFLEGKIEYKIFDNIEEAFYEALKDAKKESLATNVLLAPACASLDQFKNFEDRGNQFINLYKINARS